MAETAEPIETDTVRTHLVRLIDRLDAELIGRAGLVERLTISLLVGGHVLIEGAPGLAKTRAAKRLATGFDGTFRRIQCTPDLLPADITGTMIFRQEHGAFEFIAGPVFNNLVLVDEINRAPPKVQSALLEAMGEYQVTVGGETRPIPRPFMVVATQNSIEQEGTYPLPEAQLDRFLLHVGLDYPGGDEERAILDLVERENSQGEAALTDAFHLRREEVEALMVRARAVHLSPAVKDYAVRLVMATRGEGAGAEMAQHIEYPAGPRATLALAAASRAKAFIGGRDFVIPEDVRDLAEDAMSHRIGLTYRAEAEGQTARGIISSIVEQVPLV